MKFDAVILPRLARFHTSELFCCFVTLAMGSTSASVSGGKASTMRLDTSPDCLDRCIEMLDVMIYVWNAMILSVIYRNIYIAQNMVIFWQRL